MKCFVKPGHVTYSSSKVLRQRWHRLLTRAPVHSSSEQAGLFHDAEELLFADLAVPIPVCLINHLLNLLVCQVLTQLLGYPLQVLEGDEACRSIAAAHVDVEAYRTVLHVVLKCRSCILHHVLGTAEHC